MNCSFGCTIEPPDVLPKEASSLIMVDVLKRIPHSRPHLRTPPVTMTTVSEEPFETPFENPIKSNEIKKN
jgi:hypothetical protein